MLKPLGKRLLIQPVEQKHGTLIVKNQKPSQYKVITIGDEVTKIQPYDIIYLEKHYGTEIEHEQVKYLVIDESSALVKLDPQ